MCWRQRSRVKMPLLHQTTYHLSLTHANLRSWSGALLVVTLKHDLNPPNPSQPSVWPRYPLCRAVAKPCVVSGRLASTNRLSSWCAPTAGSSFCWTRLTWPWLSECQPPPLNRTGESASAMGVTLAGGGVEGDTSLFPQEPAVCSEAGKWTGTDRLTHVSQVTSAPQDPWRGRGLV